MTFQSDLRSTYSEREEMQNIFGLNKKNSRRNDKPEITGFSLI